MTNFTNDPVAYIGVAQLMAEYMDAFDSHDLDRLLGLLGHAVVVSPTGEEISGDAALREHYSSVHPGPDASGRRLTKHNLTNLRVRRGEGPDSLEAEAYYIAVDGSSGEPRILQAGRYSIVAHVSDGQMHFHRLQVFYDI